MKNFNPFFNVLSFCVVILLVNPVNIFSNETLLLDLKNGNKEQKLNAIKEIMKLKDKNYLPPLIESLGDVAFEVQAFSMLAVKQFEALALKPLVLALNSDNKFVRGNALSLIGTLGDSGFLGDILPLTKDKAIFVKNHALVAIGRLNNDLAVPFLINMLKKEKYAPVRRTVIQTLVSLNSKDALDILIESLYDENISVRTDAVNAIYKIAGKGAVKILLGKYLDNNDSVRDEIVSLFKKNNELYSLLIEALKDKDINIYLASAEVLGKMGDPKATGHLLETLTFEYINLSAIKSLGELKAKEAVSALVDMLDFNDDSVRYEVIASLGKIKDLSSIEPIKYFLLGQSIKIKKVAVLSLLEINYEGVTDDLRSVLGKTRNKEVRAFIRGELDKLEPR